MKTLLILLQVLLVMGCQSQNTLPEILESKFGKALSIEKEAEIFKVYKWESFEDEYGRKFKNEIDKGLNVLPYKTDTKLGDSKGNAVITDIYKWETPQIFVELEHSFMGIDGKIKSNIRVKINQK